MVRSRRKTCTAAICSLYHHHRPSPFTPALTGAGHMIAAVDELAMGQSRIGLIKHGFLLASVPDAVTYGQQGRRCRSLRDGCTNGGQRQKHYPTSCGKQPRLRLGNKRKR